MREIGSKDCNFFGADFREPNEIPIEKNCCTAKSQLRGVAMLDSAECAP
jgi:hypothetical protein